MRSDFGQSVCHLRTDSENALPLRVNLAFRSMPCGPQHQ